MPAEPNPAQGPARASTPPPALLSFRAIQDPDLSPRACQVLWALTYWAWGAKPDCWPSNRQIGKLIGCSPRTVQLRLNELAKAGYIWRRMEKTPTGWHRVLTITERAKTPPLTVVGGGSATHCATPPGNSETGCATPPQSVAPPLAQSVAHQRFEESEEREKELAIDHEPPGKGSRSPGPEEPEFLKLDNLTDADLEHWREIEAQPGHPMRSIARKIRERWERQAQEKAPRASGQRLSGGNQG